MKQIRHVGPCQSLKSFGGNLPLPLMRWSRRLYNLNKRLAWLAGLLVVSRGDLTRMGKAFSDRDQLRTSKQSGRTADSCKLFTRCVRTSKPFRNQAGLENLFNPRDGSHELHLFAYLKFHEGILQRLWWELPWWKESCKRAKLIASHGEVNCLENLALNSL